MEARATRMGDNSTVQLDSEARRALFYTHFNPLWEIQKQLDELTAEKTKLKRQAKAEGFEGYEIDFALKIRKTEKQETIDNEMRRRMAIARYLAQPVGFQFDILGDDDRPAVDKAFDDGLTMGLRGESLRNTFEQSVPQWRAMNDGYAEGQRQLREAMQERMEVDNERKAEEGAARAAQQANGEGAPKGRGRPKGSKNKPKPDAGSFTEQLADVAAQGDAIAKGEVEAVG